MTEKCMTPLWANICAWTRASFFNHGAEAHTSWTRLHFGIFEQKFKKKTRKQIHNLKTCPNCIHGPCLTTAIWRCRKNSSQWQRSFQWKLYSHWLKFLRQRHVAVVRQAVPDKNSPTISQPCITREPWNHQHSTVVIVEDKHIVVWLF